MAASAALTIAVTAGTPAARAAVEAALNGAAGSSGGSVDPSGTRAVVHLQMPGNITKLMRTLWSTGACEATTIDASIPVRKQAEHPIDAVALIASLNSSPAVANAAYDGPTVTATIAGTTSAMRYVYEEIIVAGLMPVDMPTVAGPLEFVL